MPSLIISRNSEFVGVFPLLAKTQIGRSSSNDIVLEDAGISRIHASIDQQENRFFLMDEGSTNGTFFEDRRVERHLLANGTSFRIQDYLLTFVEDFHTHEVSSEELTCPTLIGRIPKHLPKSVWQTQHITVKEGLQEKVFRLLKLVNDLVTAPGDADPAALAMDALFSITGAKRGIVAMKQPQGELVFTHIRGFTPQDGGAKVSRDLFQQVLDNGVSIYSDQIRQEKLVPRNFAFEIKSMLCVPMKASGQTVGCLYLDHPDQAGVFSETDRDLLVAAADQITEALMPDKPQPGKLGREDERLAGELEKQGIIARSPKTLKVFRDCQSIARYTVSVLIFGETGTGKEIIARYIHDQSNRRGRFIARNCSAIAASMFESELFGHEKGAFTGAAEQKPGLLELADHGTLFLDEIGDMPADLQSKLLRALQEKEVWRVGGRAPVKIDVRVLAATHKDIKKRRKQLNFRDDLYYRLANVEITAPSLRDRPEDIAPLCDMILKTFRGEHAEKKKPLSVSPKAMRLLEAYDWPGNIRELRNMLIQISFKCEGTTIDPRHLKGLIDVYDAPSDQGPQSLPPLWEVERDHIIKVLKFTKWNKSAAAKVLSIDRNRLNRRLKNLGID